MEAAPGDLSCLKARHTKGMHSFFCEAPEVRVEPMHGFIKRPEISSLNRTIHLFLEQAFKWNKPQVCCHLSSDSTSTTHTICLNMSTKQGKNYTYFKTKILIKSPFVSEICFCFY